ncbi:uncharacterized protein B0T15DRAFT_291845 [Chaetomium strumarium]|uniref:Transcription factor Iwr1 domain-containing protein n=1 Tax=Chaetomium strumarium TaxID=1170767 RepID=A0AAJ0LY73_9PEZI|nr:hypothetical protein B0T15DRAFT_291845 [Chaetomium strumarium]
MAARPPTQITVKRKRGDDDNNPVDFLRLERSKRSRSVSGDLWLYQRKTVVAKPAIPAAEPSAAAIPTIQPTRDGDEKRLLKRSHKAPPGPAGVDGTTSENNAAGAPTAEQPASIAPSHLAAARTRRFYLSRSYSPQPTAGVSKKRSAPAVFVERDAKKQRESLKAVIEERNIPLTQATNSVGGSQSAQSSSSGDERPTAASLPETTVECITVKYKRPGDRGRFFATRSKIPTAASILDRGNDDMDEITRRMDSWVIDEINKNREKVEAQDAKSKYSPATSRFKPKAPQHRRSETAQQAASTSKAEDVNGGDTTDEEDYVVDTYELVPAERLLDQPVPADRVGLLVFETEPDMVEFFYSNESDDDDEMLEDEDDENAENYYANDYPDEDMDWDDEFGHNAYHYMNRNASDLEEFDERDYDAEELDRGKWSDAFWERCERDGSKLQ